MKYSSRFFLWGPFSLFVALALGVAIHWWFAAANFSKHLDAINGHDAMPGVAIRFTSKTISGFPFRLDAEFENLALTVTTAHGPAMWRSEHFAMHALTYGRAQEILEAAGTQNLGWTDDKGVVHALRFVPAELRASSIADAKGLVHFDLDLVGAGGTDTPGHDFSVGRAQLHMRRDPAGNALDLMLYADELEKPGGITPQFGDHLRTFRSYALLTHTDALAKLLRGNEPLRDATMGWRGAGGRIEIDRLDVASAGPSRAIAPEARASLAALLSGFF